MLIRHFRRYTIDFNHHLSTFPLTCDVVGYAPQRETRLRADVKPLAEHAQRHAAALQCVHAAHARHARVFHVHEVQLVLTAAVVTYDDLRVVDLGLRRRHELDELLRHAVVTHAQLSD